MGATAFFGLLFIGGGPLLVLFLSFIARKSFLVLLALGCAFYWLVTLFIISSLFRGFTPIPDTPASYSGLVLMGVAIQEAAKYLLWKFHNLTLTILQHTAAETNAAPLNKEDHISLALTYGFSHAMTHSLFFFLSWLPLSLGEGTVYAPTCPAMSYYLVGALTTLGMGGVLTGGMIISFEYASSLSSSTDTYNNSNINSNNSNNDNIEGRWHWMNGNGDWKHMLLCIVPSIIHAVAACVTLNNFAMNGCIATVATVLALGMGMSCWAGWLWWKKTGEELLLSRRGLRGSGRVRSRRRGDL